MFCVCAGMKTTVSEAEHPLLCEGTRRVKGDLALALMITYKDDQCKLKKVRRRSPEEPAGSPAACLHLLLQKVCSRGAGGGPSCLLSVLWGSSRTSSDLLEGSPLPRGALEL